MEYPRRPLPLPLTKPTVYTFRALAPPVRSYQETTLVKRVLYRVGCQAYLLLHRGLERRVRADLVKPLRVDRTSRSSERESQTRPGIVLVQNVDLGRNL